MSFAGVVGMPGCGILWDSDSSWDVVMLVPGGEISIGCDCSCVFEVHGEAGFFKL